MSDRPGDHLGKELRAQSAFTLECVCVVWVLCFASRVHVLLLGAGLSGCGRCKFLLELHHRPLGEGQMRFS